MTRELRSFIEDQTTYSSRHLMDQNRASPGSESIRSCMDHAAPFATRILHDKACKISAGKQE